MTKKNIRKFSTTKKQQKKSLKKERPIKGTAKSGAETISLNFLLYLNPCTSIEVLC